MPNLHRARFALPATLIAALVAGCGGGSSGGTANTTSTTSGTTTATTTSTTTSTGSGSTSTTATPTAAAGIVTLANANFAATASTGSVTVTAVRQGGSSGEATVSYTTVNGTAIAGTDYTATSGTLTWTDGDAAPKTFTVPVSIQDLGTKTFTVQLAHATDASLGTTASARVTILGRALTSKNTGGTGATTSTGSSTTGTSTTGTSTTGSSTTSGTTSTGTTSTGTTSGTSGTTSTGTTSTTSSGSTTASGSTFWVYYNGVFNWPGDYSYVASIDYKDTSGAPLSGGADIKVSLTGAYGAWQPYSTNWSFDSSPYTKLTFALKPTSANDRWQIQFIKVGDIPVGISLNVLNYGPAPVVGQWGVYTIPLADLGVLGTSIYKFAIQDESGNGGSVFYVDNVGFVP
ncbi:MAG TPA: Calx-beta domain-containing protein [Burkholderiaceae bacterium]|nr:Calx-beta domain-containing protein [Burkholderiaceae bacterium]